MPKTIEVTDTIEVPDSAIAGPDPLKSADPDGLSPGSAAERDLPAPQPPPACSAEQRRELEEAAESLVAQLADASGSAELEMLTALSNLGAQTQRQSGRDLDLLRGRIRGALKQDGANADLWRALTDMRRALARIDPHELERQSLPRRIFNLFGRGGASGRVGVLQRIAIRHETVSQEIDHIESRLREAMTMLARDNAELVQLYEQVETHHVEVQRHAYVGELVARRLRILKDEADERRRERLESALHAVAVRVQDLRAMEEVQRQFFAGIEITHENNVRLAHSVDRTLSLSGHVVTVGLAIQVALDRQRRVREATQRTREFLGEMIAANASAIRRHTEEIGDVYNNPVIAIEKIAQAHQDLREALASAERIKQRGIAAAADNVSRLAQMTAELPEPRLLDSGTPAVEV